MNTLHSRFAASVAVLALVGGMTFLISRAGHTSGGPVPVQVANTPTAPVFSSTTDDPRQPFEEQGTAYFTPGMDTVEVLMYTVPVGKRLVLDCASAGDVAVVSAGYAITVLTGTGPYQGFARFNVTPSTAPYPSITQPLKLYADGGSKIYIFVERNGKSGYANVNLSVTGHFVDTP